MRVDTNTRGHRQWFYFSIKSKTKKMVKLNIYRFKKAFSLFQRGMKPYVKSIKSQQDWKQGGLHVKYIREKDNNDFGVKKPLNSYYLSFQYQFQHEEDEVFFAAGIPYTYTFLQERIFLFQQSAQNSNQIKLQTFLLGKSMCGLDVKAMKIQHSQVKENERKIIAINARTHSGEASCSWVLDGLIDYILKESQLIDWMKQFNISFHILPMLNVDGAFVGNYRTGIVGDDFNRKFSSGKKEIFPEIYYLKKMITNAKKQGELLMFLDLHGHSILKNSFIYGPSQSDFENCILKKLPFYLWHKSKYFKMSSCKFKTERDKMQTARIYFQLKEDVLSYTCENSLGLYSANQQSFQMKKQDWQKFGISIIEALKATIEEERSNYHVFKGSQNQDCCKQDLRDTDTPPKKQVSKILPAAKSIQIPKLTSKNKDQNWNNKQKSRNESFIYSKKFPNTTMRSFSISTKKQSNKIQKGLTPIQQKNTQKLKRETNETSAKDKLSQIRQRFPSLTSKQLKSKETIQNQLKNAYKQDRLKINSSIQRNKTQDAGSRTKKYDSAFSNVNTQQFEQKSIRQKQNTREKNQKRQFLESIYHRKQLKQLKQLKHQTDHFDLGKSLIPVQEIKKKVQQKRQRATTNYQKPSTNKSNHRKQSYEFKEYQASQNLLEDVQVSLNFPKQRSITYDQSYLASHIKKLSTMKETEREYADQNGQISEWNQDQSDNDQAIKFKDDFSQNFDDSVNDLDSCSEDLPQNEKKHVLEYIRSHQNARRDRMFDSSSSQEEKVEQEKILDSQKPQSSELFNHKKRIHGFRQIVFKSAANDSDQMTPNKDSIKLATNSYAASSKIRKNPHKFKQSFGIVKFHSISRKIEPQDQIQQSQIYITHKKKLNERSMRKDQRKDPFVLISIKDKPKEKIIH